MFIGNLIQPTTHLLLVRILHLKWNENLFFQFVHLTLVFCGWLEFTKPTEIISWSI
jgi:hypothetical protein